MLATLVDTDALFKVVLYSLGAGVGVTAVFSLALVSASRSVDHRREGNWLGAGLFGAFAAAGLLACAAFVVLGIGVMTDKA
jgi:hypothetical protein